MPIVRGGETTKMEEGEFYAIETFGSTGKGYASLTLFTVCVAARYQSSSPNFFFSFESDRGVAPGAIAVGIAGAVEAGQEAMAVAGHDGVDVTAWLGQCGLAAEAERLAQLAAEKRIAEEAAEKRIAEEAAEAERIRAEQEAAAVETSRRPMTTAAETSRRVAQSALYYSHLRPWWLDCCPCI